MKRRQESKNTRQALAALLAAVASAAVLVLPLYTEVELSAGGFYLPALAAAVAAAVASRNPLRPAH